MSAAFKRGRDAFNDGKIRSPELYGVVTAEHADWLRGWDAGSDAWAAECVKQYA